MKTPTSLALATLATLAICALLAGCGAQAGAGESCDNNDDFCTTGLCLDLSEFSTSCNETVCSRACQSDDDCTEVDSPVEFTFRCLDSSVQGGGVCVPVDKACVAEGME